ncbi:hypothetical protein CFOL_v3_34033 [Cephalotus follicularis]|uniref:F-box protein At3g26010-like beta-propeller domain-containing protein n=1 Tax=Cephalotus follicularis TaxID=3775 RepID=A0A1Q3DDX0_CEPFO|nr:hypothetical protein CFOL_v3_34033 [Cephalotus follicularis]
MDRGKCKFFGNRNKIVMDLNEIIREHALPFLPAKSLFRCTGVCRDWKLQISTPFFAHNQSVSFHDMSGFFSQCQSDPPSFTPLNPMAYGVPDPSLSFLPELVDIIASSNGLLCCQGRTRYNAYYICNPVTKHWKKLPKPTADHGSDPAVVLVFEPSLLSFVAEYKLVCAFPSELDGYEFEIYSSVEGSWRVTGEICFGDRRVVPRSGVHADGIIYWQTMHSGIMAFDLQMERSQLLSHYGHGKSALGAMNRKLCSASIVGSKITIDVLSNPYTNTMQMHSGIKTWETKVLTINLDATEVVLDSSSLLGVLFVNDDVVVFRAGTKLFSYYLKTQRIMHLLAEFAEKKKFVAYVNSLVEI